MNRVKIKRNDEKIVLTPSLKTYILLFVLFTSNLYANDFVCDLKEISNALGSNDTVFINYIDYISNALAKDGEDLYDILSNAPLWGVDFFNYSIFCNIYTINTNVISLYTWEGDRIDVTEKLHGPQFVKSGDFRDVMNAHNELCNIVKGVFAHDFLNDSEVGNDVTIVEGGG